MLKFRIITASVLIPLVIAGIYFTSPWYFNLVVNLILTYAGWEYSYLLGIESKVSRLAYVIFLSLAYYLALLKLTPQLILSLGSLFWLLCLFWLIYYARTLKKTPRILRGLAGVAILLPFAVGLSQLKALPNGPEWLLSMMLFVWGVDSGAYFSGKRWGKHKLAPQISPGKTWEGFYGALATAVMIAILQSFWFNSVNFWAWLGLGILSLYLAVIGDLLESLLKRQQGIKESGKLLPGHGGLLDRIDSLLAVTPLFTLGVMEFVS